MVARGQALNVFIYYDFNVEFFYMNINNTLIVRVHEMIKYIKDL